jgi:hypothetical protein
LPKTSSVEGLTKESATCRIVVDIQSSKLYLHRRIQALLTARAHRTLAPYARTHAPYALTVRKFWWQNRAFCQQNQRFCQQNPGFWKQFCARSAGAQCERAVCACSACSVPSGSCLLKKPPLRLNGGISIDTNNQSPCLNNGNQSHSLAQVNPKNPSNACFEKVSKELHFGVYRSCDQFCSRLGWAPCWKRD